MGGIYKFNTSLFLIRIIIIVFSFLPGMVFERIRIRFSEGRRRLGFCTT